MQNHSLLSIFSSLFPDPMSAFVAEGRDALYVAIDLFIHSVKQNIIICPLRAIMLAEGKNIHIVFTLNSNLKNSCYLELWLHQRPYLKCGKHSVAICMGTLSAKPVAEKQSYLKWAIRRLLSSGFPGSLAWERTIETMDRSLPPPHFPSLVICPTILGADSAGPLTALSVCSSLRPCSVLFMPESQACLGSHLFLENPFSLHCPHIQETRIQWPLPLISFCQTQLSQVTWKPSGTSSLPCYSSSAIPTPPQGASFSEAYFSSPLWGKPMHSVWLLELYTIRKNCGSITGLD